MRVWLLGGFRVSVGSRIIEEDAWRLRKAANLIKLLALAPGHRLHTARVMDLLWPHLAPKAVSNNLRQVLHGARRILDPDPAVAKCYLSLREEQLALCPKGLVWVDVEAFEQAAAAARREMEPLAYRAALDLYGGELLPGNRYEEWAEGPRARLRGTYLALLFELARSHEKRGEYEPAAEGLREVVAEEPLREEAHAGLMRLFAFSGERQLALSQYEQLRKTLSSELGIEPGAASRRLHQEIVAGRFPPDLPQQQDPSGPEDSSDRRHNLPNALTSFVGRERELVEVKRDLAMTRLLTLVGTGGSGKTRLALEVARDLVPAYPDGAWIVELAGLSEEELVPQEVAKVLGIRERPGSTLLETLTDALCEKDGRLLVLDNCEHLVGACAHLAERLLVACGGLRILATSREPLGVPGELSWRVPPLQLPEDGSPQSVERLMRYESARLFAERARYRNLAFALTPHSAGAVAKICRRLEGIPLAIELAAARVGLISAEQIAERLDDSLGLLTAGSRTVGPRQRTLEGALDWSYELLSEPERVLFYRLSAFAGGWTLEAAEVVGAEGGIAREAVLDLLSRLVEKSLVVAEANGSGTVRYRMLESIRQYGRKRLEESGKADAAQRRHAEFFLGLAEEAESELRGSRQGEWLERLEVEHDNLRVALGWSLDRKEPQQLGLRMGAALWWFWYTRGHPSEGRRWLEEHLSRSGSGVTKVRAKALNGAGWIAMFQGKFEDAKASSQEALALFRELEDAEGVGSALVHLGTAAVLGQLDDVPVPVLLEEATRLRPKISDPRTLGTLLLLLGLFAAVRGEFDRSEALHEEALALFRKVEDVTGISHCLNNLGLAMLAGRAYEKASGLFQENLRVALESDHKVTIHSSLLGLGGVATSRGQPARAARLWGAVKALEDDFGIRMTPAGLSLASYEGYLALARSRLKKEEFAAAWAEGKAMTTEQAIEYALSDEEPILPAARPTRRAANGKQAAKLTRREEEIVALVARGLTNRQISEELFVSERTVDVHVRKVLKKLKLRSRAQIAVWATEQQLTSPEDPS